MAISRHKNEGRISYINYQKNEALKVRHVSGKTNCPQFEGEKFGQENWYSLIKYNEGHAVIGDLSTRIRQDILAATHGELLKAISDLLLSEQTYCLRRWSLDRHLQGIGHLCKCTEFPVLCWYHAMISSSPVSLLLDLLKYKMYRHLLFFMFCWPYISI